MVLTLRGYRLPSAQRYAAVTRRRGFWITALIIFVSAALMGVLTRFQIDSPVIPPAVLVALLSPLVLWHFPRVALYFTLATVCLIEVMPSGFHDIMTDETPLFWNVNTIVQRYGHVNFKGLPFNLLELVLIIAGVCSLVRSVYSRSVNLRAGPLFVPISAYIAFVVMGWINGMATGGDFNISLQEVRSQVYFLLAYCLAINLIEEKKQIGVILRLMIGCIGLKGILLVIRRFTTYAGQPIPDQGVGEHEEVFFFNCYLLLIPVLSLCGVHRRLRRVMWVGLPFVIMADLFCNRRAGIAALMITVPIIFMMAFVMRPRRRLFISSVGIGLTLVSMLYYQGFKNSESTWAEPARAIRSQFDPDARDASSNAYRDAENADLMATIKSAPLQGYGYGKRMFHAVPIADISLTYEWWDIMTHDQILWVWMRVGTFGFIAFWMMVAAIIIYCCQLLRDLELDPEFQTVAIVAVLVVAMLMIFGLLDLQLSNYRDMLFGGFWAGVAASIVGMENKSGIASVRVA